MECKILQDEDLIKSLNGVQYQRLIAFLSEITMENEKTFRKGYFQGFLSARCKANSHITSEELKDWRYEKDLQGYVPGLANWADYGIEKQ